MTARAGDCGSLRVCPGEAGAQQEHAEANRNAQLTALCIATLQVPPPRWAPAPDLRRVGSHSSGMGSNESWLQSMLQVASMACVCRLACGVEGPCYHVPGCVCRRPAAALPPCPCKCAGTARTAATPAADPPWGMVAFASLVVLNNNTSQMNLIPGCPASPRSCRQCPAGAAPPPAGRRCPPACGGCCLPVRPWPLLLL